MEHHDWDWSDGASGDGDAETADLNDGPDLGGFEHDAGFGEHFDVPGDDHPGGDQFTAADTHHDGGIEEPLGTENATAHYDESLAHFDGPDAHHDADPTTGHGDDPNTDHGDGQVDPHADAVDPDHGDDHGDGHGDDHDDGYGDGHEAHAETLVGTDPDIDHGADHADWHDDNPFPPGLDIHAPEPVDGFPWSDPATLGDGAGPDDYAPDYSHLVNTGDEGGPAHAADLAQYDGVEVPPGTDAWTHLLGSEDPATSALARWWTPGT
jgi:hypothetical protein